MSPPPPTSESRLQSDPKEWSHMRKWTITILLSCFTLISPMSSSMVAPALNEIAHDINVKSDFTKQLLMSIFVLLYGIGPVVVGPLSEQYGRVPLLQLGNCLYITFNAACGAARTPAQMLAFRALSGFGGGAPLSIGAAVIGDLFKAEERGKAVAIYNMAPLLGPSLGPIVGAIVIQYISWRWIFYIMSAFDFVVLFISFFLLKETYVPVLLERQRRKEHGKIANEASMRAQIKCFVRLLAGNFARPLRMLFLSPIIQLLSLYVGYLYGVMYLVLSTFANLWVERYHQIVLHGGLHYIALGLGYILGSQICALSLDKIYLRLKRKNNDIGVPEFRLPLAILSAFLVPAGLIVYAWSAQYRIFWLVPDLGAVLFSMGAMVGMQCSTNYLLDTYPQHTASAIGAVTLLRGFAGFGLPLSAPYMYARLDYGWGNTLLAFIAILIGIAAPVAIWFFGRKIRERSNLSDG